MGHKREHISQQLNRRIKILGLITVISVAIVLALAYASLLFQQKERFTNLKKNSVLEVESYLSEVFSSLRSISDALIVSNDKANLLNMALSHREKIKEVYLIEGDKVTSSSVYMIRNINLSDKQLRGWIDDGFSKDTYISHPFFENNTIPYVYIGVKARDEMGDVLQTLVARLDLSNLWVYLNRMDLDKRGRTMIYNSSGQIVLHSNLNTLSSVSHIGHIFDHPEFSKDIDLKLKSKNKENYFLVTGQLISDTNWYLMIEYPLDNATSLFFLSIFMMALIFLVIVFLIYRINNFIRKKIIDSIFLLQDAVEELEAGNLNYRIEGLGNNELGYIASVLNKLSSRLSNTLRNLKNRIAELDENKQALERSEANHRTVVNNVKEVLFNTDNQGDWQFLNPAWEKTTGFDIQASLGRSFSDFIYIEDLDNCNRIFKQILNGEKSIFEGEVRILKKTGEYLFMQIFVSASMDDEGNIQGVTGTLNDITERKVALSQLKLTSKVYTNAREAILITDSEGFIIDANDSYKKITGYDTNRALKKNIGVRFTNLNPIHFAKDALNEAKQQGYWNGELNQIRKNGEEFVISATISTVKEGDKIQNYVLLFADITKQNEYKKQLEYNAHYDSLTGLPNRILLSQQMKEGMQTAINNDCKMAICYLDLDGFKEVNDIYGHAVGDKLLIDIAESMKLVLREHDSIARPGGDEFVAVLMDVDEKSSIPILKQLLNAVSQPMEIEGNRVQVSVSLGATFYPQSADLDADQLLRQADQAMYQAKISGKNRYHFFDTDKDRDLRDINQLLEQIDKGLKKEEFVLFYQPQVSMKTGELLGFEALIRWQHPEKGLLSPYYFLDALKNQPLSIDVGNWVIRQAIAQLSKWNKQGFRTVMSVNVDSFQLQQSNFISSLVAVLDEFPDVDNDQLEFEILESNALEDISLVSQVIKSCRAMKIHFSLDDFGTGFSSLSHLKNLPVRDLKIDRSFVRDMLDDLDDLSILDGTLGLAEAFRRGVVAEGVETQDQGKILLKLGCEVAQGYFIAKPMPEHEVLDWIKSWTVPDDWKNEKQLRRKDVPLLFLLLGHQNWRKQFIQFVTSKEGEHQMDWENCRFDDWLREDGHLNYDDDERISELISLHDKVHEFAQKMVDRRAQNPDAPLTAMENEFKDISDQLTVVIKELSSSKLD